MINTLRLSELAISKPARITAIQSSESDRQRLYALGIHEEMDVRVLHEGPVGGDPIAIDLDGHVVALRRADAANIHVQESQTDE